jgi:Leucine-rich repeat (LRR) protein
MLTFIVLITVPTGAVNGNNVGGTMPFEMSLLPSLSRIAISGNILGGSIPDSWTGLTTLEAIVLANNKLTGLLPGFLISNNPNLRQIRLNDNQLSQLPESATSESLTLLDLANNNLMGSIPTGLKGLNALRKFFSLISVTNLL